MKVPLLFSPLSTQIFSSIKCQIPSFTSIGRCLAANLIGNEERTFVLRLIRNHLCDRVLAIAFASALAPLQVIAGSAIQEKLQTMQVICRDVERRKCPGDKHVPWKAEYLLGQSSAVFPQQ